MLTLSRPRLSAFAALSLLLPLTIVWPRPASAQTAPAILTITVRAADTGRPLKGALISSVSRGLQGTTDGNGMLRLTELGPGSHTIRARFLGYAAGAAEVQLSAGRSEALRLDLAVQPLEVPAVRVQARRSLLEINGFNGRRSAGFGTFVTREEIVRMQPRFLSDVLRRVAGMELSPGRPGGSSRARMRGTKVMMGSCPIQYYLDGTMAAYFNVDDVRPEDVAGLEIYRGAATIPPAYNKGTALCGVVLIWTRDR